MQRETLQFIIKDKNIYYTDRKWNSFVRCIPKDEGLIKKILMSRNKIPLLLVRLFDLTDREIEQYNNAKTEEDLAGIIIKDAKFCGLILLRKEIENVKEETKEK